MPELVWRRAAVVGGWLDGFDPPGGVGALVSGSFSTNFNNDETPVSEGGVWQVSDASNFTGQGVPPFTSGGVWRSNAGSSGNDDSVSFLKTAVGIKNNQTITAVASVTGAFGVAEIEIHHRSSWGAGFINTYEVDIIDSLSTVNLVRWDGGPGMTGTATTIGSGPIFSALADGDVFVSTVDANGHFTLTQNGHSIYTSGSGFIGGGVVADTTYPTGSCGLGGDIGTGNTNNIGWTSFAVVST